MKDVLLAVVLLLVLPLIAAAAEDRRISASQAVLLMQNPNDDLNVSYYTRGVMDTAIGNIVSCPDVRTDFDALVDNAKQMARVFVANGKGETKFGNIVVAALIKAGCR